MVGMIQGGAGTLIGLGALYLGFFSLSTHFGQDTMAGLITLRFFPLGAFIAIIFGGVVIGWLGCWISLRHFMRSCMERGCNLIIGLMILACLAAPRWVWAGQTGEVQVSNLNLRSGPGQDYPVLKRLTKGSRVTVDGKHQGWLQVTHSGTQGFVIDDDQYLIISTHTIESPSAADEKKVKVLQSEAENIHMQLKDARKEFKALTAKEKEILDEFNILEQELNRNRNQVRNARSAITVLEEKIAQIQIQYKSLEKQIRAREAYAAQRLVALYKLDWLGRIHFLASADSFFDFIQRKSAMERILDNDNQALGDLRNDQIELESLLEQLQASRAKKRSLELALQQEEVELKNRQKQRRIILDRIENEKSLELAALQNLEQAAKQINSTIEKAAPTPAPKQQEVSTASPGSAESSFQSYKGLLGWPVQGKVISYFGPQKNGKFNIPTFQSGIDIQAERGEPVRAVAQGYTIFSSWFNGFGNMIIIDHGRHYYTVYAHLEEAFKFKGDRVEKGEVIATLGDSGSLLGPALHFEVRHHGKPTDPLLWIKNG
jgi:septal ring factor EnvC (AmiA/AmiB activator)